jgi:hypothetical protein
VYNKYVRLREKSKRSCLKAPCDSDEVEALNLAKKKLKKVLDKWQKVCYNVSTVREGKPNKPERN